MDFDTIRTNPYAASHCENNEYSDNDEEEYEDDDDDENGTYRKSKSGTGTNNNGLVTALHDMALNSAPHNNNSDSRGTMRFNGTMRRREAAAVAERFLTGQEQSEIDEDASMVLPNGRSTVRLFKGPDDQRARNTQHRLHDENKPLSPTNGDGGIYNGSKIFTSIVQPVIRQVCYAASHHELFIR